MIKYALQCDQDHGFEAWFRDSAAFDAQAAQGDLVCPLCGSARVRKAVMAPRIAAGRACPPEDDTAAPPETTVAGTATDSQQAFAKAGRDEARLRRKLRELREVVESSCSYVGPDFAEEARKMHYGETEARGIYGETSQDEAEALHDEGIAFARLPWVSRGDA